MAAFYGTVEGNRGVGTRIGSKDSGMKVSAQSYDGSVVVRMWYNQDNELMVSIETADKSTNYWTDKTIYRGKFNDLKPFESEKGS